MIAQAEQRSLAIEQAKKAKFDRFNQDNVRKQEFFSVHVLKPKEEMLQRRDKQMERENSDYLEKIDSDHDSDIECID